MHDEFLGRYSPSPIDTECVALPEALLPLVEKLAENAHEVWAFARISEGWVWGATRCDIRKHHPCLVPYSELPNSEREYDRSAVVSTLKLVLAMGYRIVEDR